MKNLILITSLFLFSTVQAQTYTITLNNKIVEVKDGSEVSYSFDARSLTYREFSDDDIQIMDAQSSHSWDIDKITNYATTALLVIDLNLWQSLTSQNSITVNCSDSCIAVPFDSGEVIGDFMYFYANGSDTTIVDISSVSKWDTTGGKYSQKLDLPFNQEFQGYSIVNNSLDFGGVELPFVGIVGEDLGSYKAFSGYVDPTSVGGGKSFLLGYTDFLGGKFHNVEIVDTIEIAIRSQGNITTEAENEFSVTAGIDINNNVGENINNTAGIDIKNNAGERISNTAENYISFSADSSNVQMRLNSNGLVLPILATEPTGELGAIYYNTTLGLFRKYGASGWENL